MSAQLAGYRVEPFVHLCSHGVQFWHDREQLAQQYGDAVVCIPATILELHDLMLELLQLFFDSWQCGYSLSILLFQT